MLSTRRVRLAVRLTLRVIAAVALVALCAVALDADGLDSAVTAAGGSTLALQAVHSVVIAYSAPATPNATLLPSPTPLPPRVRAADALLAAPARTGANGLLILQRADFGRYSNQRLTLGESLAMAWQSDRSLLLPGMSGWFPPSRVLNFSAMSARVVPTAYDDGKANLTERCGPAGVYIRYRSMALRHFAPMPYHGVPWWEWRGVNWTLLDASSLPVDPTAVEEAYALMPGGALLNDLDVLMKTAPYSDCMTPMTLARDFPFLMTDPLFPLRLGALAGHRCVVLELLFLNFNWVAVPGLFQRVHASLRHTTHVVTAADAFLESVGLGAGNASAPRFASLHLRLGDFTGYEYGMTSDCKKSTDVGEGNRVCILASACELSRARSASAHRARATTPRLFPFPRAVVASIVAFLKAFGLANAPLLVGTDDLVVATNDCLRAMHAVMPRVVHVDFPSEVNEVKPAMVQEVLSRGAVFVGNAMSTFSLAVHEYRLVVRGVPPERDLLIGRAGEAANWPSDPEGRRAWR